MKAILPASYQSKWNVTSKETCVNASTTSISIVVQKNNSSTIAFALCTTVLHLNAEDL